MKTIPLIEQLKASAEIYERELSRIEELSDAELLNLFASDSTVARVLGIASDSTVARVRRLRKLFVPIVEDLDRKMYEATRNGENFDMTSWHCGTTHCRAGWAITLAGEAGSKLEEAVGSAAAGRYIYEASTGRPAPNFYATTKDALADIERCAGVSA
jgi:hypothetical protein